MYEVIGGVRSRAFRVIWMLEELGVPYRLNNAAPRSDAVRAHNPSGKIPVLLVDGEAITDSTAIIQFLADTHHALTAPAGSLARARQDGVTQFVLDEMDALLWTASRHSFILPEDKRVPEVKESLKWEWHQSLERLASHLGDSPFLMGEAFTVPDIIATHCLNWAVSAKFAPPQDTVAAYVSAMRKRDAFKRAQAAA